MRSAFYRINEEKNLKLFSLPAIATKLLSREHSYRHKSRLKRNKRIRRWYLKRVKTWNDITWWCDVISCIHSFVWFHSVDYINRVGYYNELSFVYNPYRRSYYSSLRPPTTSWYAIGSFLLLSLFPYDLSYDLYEKYFLFIIVKRIYPNHWSWLSWWRFWTFLYLYVVDNLKFFI
jgi:hypothetical protein